MCCHQNGRHGTLATLSTLTVVCLHGIGNYFIISGVCGNRRQLVACVCTHTFDTDQIFGVRFPRYCPLLSRMTLVLGCGNNDVE